MNNRDNNNSASDTHSMRCPTAEGATEDIVYTSVHLDDHYYKLYKIDVKTVKNLTSIL